MQVYRAAGFGFDVQDVPTEPGVLDPSWSYAHVQLGSEDYMDDPSSTRRVLRGPGRLDVAVAPDGGIRVTPLDDTITRPYAKISSLAGGE